MDKPHLRFLSHPKIEKSVFVSGLPGPGNIGKNAAQMLIEFTQAEPFAELYSPSFPDYVDVGSNGICHPPHYKFHTSLIGKTNFVILTGDIKPSVQDVVAHYDLCDEILNFIERYGCQFVVTIDGFITTNHADDVFVAATSRKLASEVCKRGGSLHKERIMGAAGLLLGLAKCRGWDGVCLLGSTVEFGTDRKAALSVFRFLVKILGINGTGLSKSSENDLPVFK